MTIAAASPVVPTLALPQRATGESLSRRASRHPMPLARLASLRTRQTVYGLATIDHRGRVADLAVLRALRWCPGTRLDIREAGRLVLVTASRDGVFRVTRQGYLHLPAAVRRWCGLGTADRVLLAAEPGDGLLVVYPPAALDAMVGEFHATALRGEPA
jgi:hypothetical protein